MKLKFIFPIPKKKNKSILPVMPIKEPTIKYRITMGKLK